LTSYLTYKDKKVDPVVLNSNATNLNQIH